MAKKTQAIPKATQNSADIAARKLLGVQSKPNAAPPKSAPSNGSSIGGRGVQGGARVRGGRA